MLLTEEVYRPRKAVALLPLIAPLVLGFFVFLRHELPERIFWLIAAISGTVSVILFVMLRAIQVRLSREGILFKAINGERLLPWSSLESVEVKWVHTGKSSHRELVFRPRGAKKASLNTSIYTRQALQAIASAAITMAPHAAIDDRVRRFAEGRFSVFAR